MYQNHAAREDTIVFPAWKETLSEHQLHEMGDKFEEIERQQFGTDGYEDAVAQIGQIEQAGRWIVASCRIALARTGSAVLPMTRRCYASAQSSQWTLCWREKDSNHQSPLHQTQHV